jgi:hypothetical protein
MVLGHRAHGPHFAERDVTRTIRDTDEAFAAATRAINRRNRDHGSGPAPINPGFDQWPRAAFGAVGLACILGLARGGAWTEFDRDKRPSVTEWVSMQRTSSFLRSERPSAKGGSLPKLPEREAQGLRSQPSG